MRWSYSSLVALICCVVLVSSLGAQTTLGENSPTQNIDDAATDTQQNLTDSTSDNSVLEVQPVVTLRARPTRCATLREGQPCYVRFSLSWESDQPITVCLVSEQNTTGKCWENELAGNFRKDLYLSETTEWNLQNIDGDSFGSVKVSVAWVYKSRRVRRNWRLF